MFLVSAHLSDNNTGIMHLWLYSSGRRYQRWSAPVMPTWYLVPQLLHDPQNRNPEKYAASRPLTGITIKLQRFHGFTPTAVKNTAKSIVPDELNVMWNNAFRCIFNHCWCEFVKPLQFYCNTVSFASSKNDMQWCTNSYYQWLHICSFIWFYLDFMCFVVFLYSVCCICGCLLA